MTQCVNLTNVGVGRLGSIGNHRKVRALYSVLSLLPEESGASHGGDITYPLAKFLTGLEESIFSFGAQKKLQKV